MGEALRLAREAGLTPPPLDWPQKYAAALERFAALVEAHEREACAKVADLVAKEIDDTNGTATYIAAAIRGKK